MYDDSVKRDKLETRRMELEEEMKNSIIKIQSLLNEELQKNPSPNELAARAEDLKLQSDLFRKLSRPQPGIWGKIANAYRQVIQSCKDKLSDESDIEISSPKPESFKHTAPVENADDSHMLKD